MGTWVPVNETRKRNRKKKTENENVEHVGNNRKIPSYLYRHPLIKQYDANRTKKNKYLSI